MSTTPDSRDSYDLVSPTAPLPLVGGRRRQRAVTDGHRLMWISVAGAAVVVVAAAVMVTVAGGGDAERSDAAPAFAAPSGTAEQTVDAVVTEEPSAAPPASPSPSPTSSIGRPARPGDLIAGMQATIDWLVRERQVSRDAGEELGERLREVREKIADGDRDEAREKLREFAEKLVSLRKKDKISSGGYDTLVAGAGQLAQTLANR